MQSLEVPTLDYPDNAKVIELLEKRPTGIFPALDGQCKMPKATDLTFAAALHKAHKEQPHFSTLSTAHMKGLKLRDEECFVVRHYAADVCYAAAGFLEKNSDALSPEFELKLRASSRPFVRQLVTGAAAKVSADGKGMMTNRGAVHASSGNLTRRKSGGQGAKPLQTSVSAKFLKGLTQLMKEIATTHPYFVRCIKPNQVLKPGVFNAAMILRQLQCSGTVECVKLMQSGYPNRAPYADLQSRFRTALPAEMSARSPKDFVKELLLATDCQPGEFQMGQDMVFFKGSKGAVLQELMLTPKEDIAAKIVTNLKVQLLRLLTLNPAPTLTPTLSFTPTLS
jgi:myosin-5